MSELEAALDGFKAKGGRVVVVGPPPPAMVTVPAQMIDDLVRAVAIIAASENPAPYPYPLDPLKPLTWGYTSHQHKACVDSCKTVMAKHNLLDWRATTTNEK